MLYGTLDRYDYTDYSMIIVCNMIIVVYYSAYA